MKNRFDPKFRECNGTRFLLLMMYLDLEQCTLYNVLFLNFCLADLYALFRPDF